LNFSRSKKLKQTVIHETVFYKNFKAKNLLNRTYLPREKNIFTFVYFWFYSYIFNSYTPFNRYGVVRWFV